jgi:small GTP-binding protein
MQEMLAAASDEAGRIVAAAQVPEQPPPSPPAAAVVHQSGERQRSEAARRDEEREAAFREELQALKQMGLRVEGKIAQVHRELGDRDRGRGRGEADLRSELLTLKLAGLEQRVLAAGVRDASVEDAMLAEDPKAVLAGLLMARRTEYGGLLRLLGAGGEAALAVLAPVLEHATDVLDVLSMAAPRQSRKPTLQVLDRVDAACQSVNAQWCDQLTTCGGAELEALASLLVDVQQLHVDMSAVQAARTVSQLLESLERCGADEKQPDRIPNPNLRWCRKCKLVFELRPHVPILGMLCPEQHSNFNYTRALPAETGGETSATGVQGSSAAPDAGDAPGVTAREPTPAADPDSSADEEVAGVVNPAQGPAVGGESTPTTGAETAVAESGPTLARQKEAAETPAPADQGAGKKAEKQRHALKIILIGDARVGKSGLLSCLHGDELPAKYEPTTGMVHQKHTIPVYGEEIKVQIWDRGGGGFGIAEKAYFKNVAVALVVYDITDRESFDAVGRWLAEVRQYAGGAVPIILVGNKADQPSLAVVDTKDDDKACVTHGFEVSLRASARRGEFSSGV